MSEMSDKPAWEVIRDLGINLELSEDDIVVEALVVAKVKRRQDFGNNLSSLVVGVSDTMDYITQVGLLELAKDIIAQGDDDEEDEDD